MDEIICMSARELANAIKSKKVSSREAVSAYLQRIEAVNPKINAIVKLTAEEALEEACEADNLLAHGNLRGPLHGIPMTIKDSLYTAGLITTSGTKGRASYMPTQNATVVARMRKAGAILLGKTNLSELAIPDETDNLVYGLTRNPYDLERSTGGSSGGEAAIIAAGGSPLGLGSDCAGSIREPAHFCGICGLKPTTGRVSLAGHFPASWGVMNTLWQVGPMAKSIEDLILTLPIISGVDWKDSAVVQMPHWDPQTVSFKNMKLAFYTSVADIAPTSETTDVIVKASNLLSDQGMVAEETYPEGIERSKDMYHRLTAADGGASLKKLLKISGTTEIHPLLEHKIKIRLPYKMSTTQYFKFRIELDKWRSSMISFMQAFDVIICPVVSSHAPHHGFSAENSKESVYTYVMPYSLVGWPCVVVRAGTSSHGMPIAVQIIARPFREDVALAVAKFIETNLGGWIPPIL